MRADRGDYGQVPIMHRWSFQRLVRWLIPVLLYAVSLCAVVLQQKETAGDIEFVADDVYRDLAVARTLATTHDYGLEPGTNTVAWRNSLWRLLVALAGSLTGRFQGALCFLTGAAGCITLLLVLRAAHSLFPFPPFVLYAAVLLVLGPGLLESATSGTATTLVSALVLWAVLAHVEGLKEGETPLGRGVITPLGLAALIRVELWVFWPLLVMHAWLVTLLERRRDGTLGFVLLRAVTGLFVLSLFVAPLVAWNLRVIRVPWPQMPGAPITADALAQQSPAQALALYRALAGQGVRAAFKALHSAYWMRGVVERVLTWAGAVFIAVLAFFRKEERPFSVILWIMLVTPIFLGLLYPIMGPSAVAVVGEALMPLGVLASAFVIFRIPFVIEAMYRRFKQGLPEPTGFQVWWASAGGFLALVALMHSVSLFKEQHHELAAVSIAREQVLRTLSENVPDDVPIASDQPGWMAWTQRRPVVDLSGESSPELLAALDENGKWNLNDLTEDLLRMGVTHVVLWQSIAQEMPGEWKEIFAYAKSSEISGAASGPRVYEIKPAGVL